MRIGHALRKLWRGLLLVCAAAMLTAAGPGAIPAASPDNPEQVLYSFCQQTGCSDGATPHAGLITDSAGNLYGTTYFGGNASDAGTVFQLTPNGSGGWTQTVLYAFCQQDACADGQNPRSGLIIDGSGNLYGTTTAGGSNGYGAMFELTPSGKAWSQTVLYSFCAQTGCADGADPSSGVIMD